MDLPFAAFKDIALSLGLPRDKLSSSLLSFMQFFSLPLDPKLIQRLRQEVLSLNLMPGDRIRQGALAATAAAGKGITLSAEALEKYAAAIAGEERHGGSAGQDGGSADGDTGSTQGGSEGGQSGTGHYGEEHGQTNGEGRRSAEHAGQQDGGDQTNREGRRSAEHAGQQDGGDQTNREGRRGAEYAGQQDGGGQTNGEGRRSVEYTGQQDGGGQTNGKRHSEAGPSPELLRDMVEKVEGRSPLLGILNKLPGKDGRRWINLPFSFSSGGVDYRVSLRLLLADTNAIPWKAECLALDVAAGQDGVRDKRRWSFTLEGMGKSDPPVFARAIVGIYPPPKRPAALERNLRELLGAVAEKIILEGGDR
ncbi:hypothetical protein AGMMS49944_29200 [Spirochaetia bacterium]|nr:hypothetical protein AGMMS49944_29200 [Spirochaetia bacterium]